MKILKGLVHHLLSTPKTLVFIFNTQMKVFLFLLKLRLCRFKKV